MKYLYRKIVILTTIITIIMSSTVFSQIKPPDIVGQSILLLEPTTGSVIYSKNPDTKMYPASTTKMITALVALDYFAPDEIITIGEEVKNLPPDSSTATGIDVGQILTVENILKGLLLSSGNDLACTLAINVIQKKENITITNYSEAEKKFAELMNEKAKSFGAVNSNFVNPHGYHDDNHYTTARDLSIIATVLLNNDILSTIVKLPVFKGNGADREMYSGHKIANYEWKNSNFLISSSTYKYAYATGIKTGYTGEAGRCLVASAEKDGTKLIAVILNSTEPGRWQDAQKLFEYGFNNFKITSLQARGEVLDSVFIRDGKFEGNTKINILADEDISGFILSDESIQLEKQVEYYSDFNISSELQPPRLKLPLVSGQVIGKVSYKMGEEVMFQKEIKAPSDINISLIKDKNIYKRAIDQKKKKDILKFIIRAFLILLTLVITFMGFRIIRTTLIRRRRRMKMKNKRRKNIRR